MLKRLQVPFVADFGEALAAHLPENALRWVEYLSASQSWAEKTKQVILRLFTRLELSKAENECSRTETEAVRSEAACKIGERTWSVASPDNFLRVTREQLTKAQTVTLFTVG